MEIKRRWINLYRDVDRDGKPSISGCALIEMSLTQKFFPRAFTSQGKLPRAIILDGLSGVEQGSRGVFVRASARLADQGAITKVSR
ncbi:hypothetical protein [Methylocapsa acidiphila]|uniref:hypothetical protein n=1 Tax=Methylocapsa acidiphila TaxID=133552 RepID=UPI000406839F|nr:hypothetical protein [Methylocapsa acidiphila]